MVADLFCVRTNGCYVCKGKLYQGLGAVAGIPVLSARCVHLNLLAHTTGAGPVEAETQTNQVPVEH
jgi:hypothetical protein